MRSLNLTPFLFGFKACSRKPPQPEMTCVVRARLVLRPGEEALPRVSRAVDEETLALLADGDAEQIEPVRRALSILGQGSLSGDRYADDDDLGEGELLYPSDFADLKLAADVMVRGTCCPPHETTRSRVAVSIASFRKELLVVGTRVRLDELGEVTEPAPFTRMAVDYAHAYGGPGFADNPVGKGHLDASAEEVEDAHHPPRSERSRVMPSRQLPNVLFPDGAAEKSGLPAGLGPLNPGWAHRRARLGRDYGDSWRRGRAPHLAADFDWRHMQAAPPDQVMRGYLRGDEMVTFENLHPRAAELRVRLPALRVRVFVLLADGSAREVPMVLDTLFADLDDEALYLTWRGLTAVADPWLRDVHFALIASEPLDGAPRPAAEHLERLRAFARDPLGLEEVVPPEMAASRAAVARLEEGDDAALAALLEHPRETDPIGAVLANLGPATAQVSAPLSEAARHVPPGRLEAEILAALRASRGGGELGSPEALARRARIFAAELREIRERVAEAPELDRAIDELEAEAARHAGTAAPTAARSVVGERSSPRLAWPGKTAADYRGRDLTGHDLAGRDLSGACFDGAILDDTNLAGARLAGASFRGAQLHRTRLGGADLGEADLSQATLHGVEARGAKLRGARLDLAHLRRSILDEADLDGARGELVRLSGCSLLRARARGASFERAEIDECELGDGDFSGARLTGCRLRACHAPRLKLERALLEGCGFKGSDLRGACFGGARGERTVWLEALLQGAAFAGSRLEIALFDGVDLSGASFHGADLRGSRFDEALLAGASFAGANLHGASLRGARIARASFARASLYLADLSESTGSGCDFTGAELAGARFDRAEARP